MELSSILDGRIRADEYFDKKMIPFFFWLPIPRFTVIEREQKKKTKTQTAKGIIF